METDLFNHLPQPLNCLPHPPPTESSPKPVRLLKKHWYFSNQILKHFLPPAPLTTTKQLHHSYRQFSKYLMSSWACSLLHLTCAIACTHASTRTTCLMLVENSMHHLHLWHLLSGTLERRKWKIEQKHQI